MLMTRIITECAFICFLKAQYFVAFLAYLRVHNVDLDVLVCRELSLHFSQSLPIVVVVIDSIMHEIAWHHLNNSLIVISSWTSRCSCIRSRCHCCCCCRWVNKWQMLIAYAQNEMLWSHNIVIFILHRSLYSTNIIIIIIIIEDVLIVLIDIQL